MKVPYCKRQCKYPIHRSNPFCENRHTTKSNRRWTAAGKQSSWEKSLIADLGTETDKISQEHIVASKSKSYEKDSRAKLKTCQLTKDRTIWSAVVMDGCESWTIKKAEHWRTDDFELWYWRRLLRVPWTARRSNQSILKEISPEHSLEGLMLKLKLQYFGHLMRRADSFEKTLMLGMTEGRRRRVRQRMRWLDGITDQWTCCCCC